jgi:hypothetical protein
MRDPGVGIPFSLKSFLAHGILLSENCQMRIDSSEYEIRVDPVEYRSASQMVNRMNKY